MEFGYINPFCEFTQEEQESILKNSMPHKLVIEDENFGQLERLKEILREGDTVMVHSLYVFNMTALQVIKLIDYFNTKKISIKTFQEGIDGDTLIFSYLAELDKKVRRGKAISALENSRPRGKLGGRKKGLSEKAKKTAVSAAGLYNSKIPIEDIRQTLKIGSKSTLYKYLRYAGVKIKGFEKS